MSEYHRTNIGASYRLDYLVSTQSSVDECIWYDAYIKGYREPRYQMPAIPRHVKFMPYKDEVWTADKPTLCLGIFKPNGLGYICERYWFNT